MASPGPNNQRADVALITSHHQLNHNHLNLNRSLTSPGVHLSILTNEYLPGDPGLVRPLHVAHGRRQEGSAPCVVFRGVAVEPVQEGTGGVYGYGEGEGEGSHDVNQ